MSERLKELMDELESGSSSMSPAEVQTLAKEIRKLAECQWKSHLRNDVTSHFRKPQQEYPPFSASRESSEFGDSQSRRPDVARLRYVDKLIARQEQMSQTKNHAKQHYERMRQVAPKVVSKLDQETMAQRELLTAEKTMARASKLLEQTRRIQEYLGSKT